MCNKIYGYCRISRKSQNIERQVRNIMQKEHEAIIIKEAYTGTKVEGRKEFEKLLKVVKPGDTIIFDSVSRMSRNAEEGIKMYEELMEKGIELEFLKESYINTSVYKNALTEKITLLTEENKTTKLNDGILSDIEVMINSIMKRLRKDQIEKAFEQAEKEVTDLHQRTREGIETARRAGKQIGQKQGAKLKVKKAQPTKEAILKYCKSFGGALNDKETLKQIGNVSRNTYYKYKRELLDEVAAGNINLDTIKH